jgi:hypothetical protein
MKCTYKLNLISLVNETNWLKLSGKNIRNPVDIYWALRGVYTYIKWYTLPSLWWEMRIEFPPKWYYWTDSIYHCATKRKLKSKGKSFLNSKSPHKLNFPWSLFEKYFTHWNASYLQLIHRCCYIIILLSPPLFDSKCCRPNTGSSVNSPPNVDISMPVVQCKFILLAELQWYVDAALVIYLKINETKIQEWKSRNHFDSCGIFQKLGFCA